ncbi:unnamed protein product [Nippostrongylus brasiliensis]|uniref:RNase H domain-containing protein n=1 Tax=Nippostrongylus brasiliensis TaxID=27835 RepID=A0A0N4Y745_NIPBR|nr:unnamed protein product [Nippostrongylus brasiliensis]
MAQSQMRKLSTGFRWKLSDQERAEISGWLLLIEKSSGIPIGSNDPIHNPSFSTFSDASSIGEGSTKPDLQDLAKKAWEFFTDLRVIVGLVPRELNTRADLASRLMDLDYMFSELQGKWGSFSLDMFANELSAKCET